MPLTSIIKTRQAEMVRQKRKEMYFIIGMGDDVASNLDAGIPYAHTPTP